MQLLNIVLELTIVSVKVDLPLVQKVIALLFERAHNLIELGDQRLRALDRDLAEPIVRVYRAEEVDDILAASGERLELAEDVHLREVERPLVRHLRQPLLGPLETTLVLLM